MQRPSHNPRAGSAAVPGRTPEDVFRAVAAIQERYIRNAPAAVVFRGALDPLVELTGSRYGFLADVRYERGLPTLTMLATTAGAEGAPAGSPGVDPTGLLGSLLRAREPVLVHDPEGDGRSDDLPAGHPPLTCFAGLPLQAEGELVGVLGLANAPHGYAAPVIEAVRPLIDACTLVVRAHRDAEQRQRDAARHHEIEALLQGIIDNAPFLLHVKDRAGRYTLVNRRFTEVFGVRADDAVGRVDEDFLPPEMATRARLHDRRVLAEDAPIETAELYPHVDGSQRHYICQRFPLRDARGRCYAVCAVATDVTERRRLERDLLRSQKFEALGQLTAGVAHDFNNLLTAILSATELLAASVHEPRAQRYAQQISVAGERAAALTSRLLSFRRGQLTEPVPVALGRLVTDLEPLLARLVGEEVALTIDVDPATPPVLADPTQLEQVVLNLVVNARDAVSASGRVSLEVAPMVVGATQGAGRHVAPGRYGTLRVRDDGVGMPAHVARRAADPFFTTKAHGEGSGLGLATSYGIVRQAGGQLQIDSIEGQGTTVTVLLPAGSDEPPALTGPAATSSGHGPSEREVVLVVEDQEPLRALLRDILADAGYDVVEAAGGAEALELAAALDRPADLLVTDVVMPAMSGTDLAARLREATPGLPVLFLSGHSDEWDVSKTHAAAFLQKPFGASQLLDAVRSVLDEAG